LIRLQCGESRWLDQAAASAWQQIPNNNNPLHLPAWAAYHSFFMDIPVDKIQVELQFGYDLNFTSRFEAMGYMPASGVFYLSNKRTTGNYAIVNAFVKLRIKSVLFSLKMEHLNDQFLIDKYYYTADNYPTGTSILKFGVSWRFMN